MILIKKPGHRHPVCYYRWTTENPAWEAVLVVTSGPGRRPWHRESRFWTKSWGPLGCGCCKVQNFSVTPSGRLQLGSSRCHPFRMHPRGIPQTAVCNAPLQGDHGSLEPRWLETTQEEDLFFPDTGLQQSASANPRTEVFTKPQRKTTGSSRPTETKG